MNSAARDRGPAGGPGGAGGPSGASGPSGAGSPPAPRCLVAGSYPPVPGPAAAATVAAVRRAWAAGLEVLVASPRPSAATYVLATTGRGLARRLGSLGREHGCDQVVLCAEPGWPLPGPVPSRLAGLPLGRRARRWAAQLSRWLYERRQASSARALAAALAGYRHAELVVTGCPEDLTPCMASLAALCRAAAAVTAASEPLAGALRRAAAGPVQVVEPFVAARLSPYPADGAAWHEVGPLEPGALLLATRARRLLGRIARRLLGRHAPAVRARLARVHALLWGIRRPR